MPYPLYEAWLPVRGFPGTGRSGLIECLKFMNHFYKVSIKY